MEGIALFGKGGSGKSTIAANLSYLFAKRGLRVLHVGCDPKRDSTIRLLGQRVSTTMLDAALGGDPRASILRSRHGIDCVETGGPPPGIGCAGRGIILTMEQFERLHVFSAGAYDVVLFDVLGDLVCGGFAAPLRHGFAKKVGVVLSDEPMSILAANNIAHMVGTYAAGGVGLAGLIGNCRGSGQAASAVIESFAARLGTRVLAHFGREPLVRRAERDRRTVAEYAPDAPVTALLERLADTLLALDAATLTLPTPLSEDELDRFLGDAPVD